MSKKPTSKPKSDSSSSKEMDRLEGVFKLMGKYNVGEIELEDDAGRVHVRMMGAAQATASVYAPTAAPQAAPQVHALPVAAKTSDSQKAAVASAASANQKQILSPFVGTFYRAANPTSEPYAKEGQAVKKGQVLCIIEAMKLMNEIESDFSGKVISVHAENGQPVEFGEPLFTIEV